MTIQNKLTAIGLGLAMAMPVFASAQTLFEDDFSSYSPTGCLPDGSNVGVWNVVFAGFGCVQIENSGTTTDQWISLVPKVPKGGNTHSSLVVGPAFNAASSSFVYEVDVNTVSQNRVGARKAPRSWEVGWVVWNYTDNEHFYYFIPKTNGWELGKRDPAYTGGQRFLATGTSPLFPIGQTYHVIITQTGNTMAAAVNGQTLIEFTDNERPYFEGKVGLYTEDAHVHFDNVVVLQP